MRRRRAARRSEGRGSRTTVPDPTSWVVQEDGVAFPIDDLPPEDVPVRDVAEEQEEYERPAHDGEITLPEGPSRTTVYAASDPGTDAPEPAGSVLEGCDPALNSVQRLGPATETSSLTDQPHGDAPLLQAQTVLPGLGLGDPAEMQLNPNRGMFSRSRRTRSSSAKVALRAAQLDLWPDSSRPHGPASLDTT